LPPELLELESSPVDRVLLIVCSTATLLSVGLTMIRSTWICTLPGLSIWDFSILLVISVQLWPESWL